MRLLALPLALAALAFAAPPATAGTVALYDAVRVIGPGGESTVSKGVRFTAAPGEANRLGLSYDGEGIRVRDDGAPVTAGEGCTQLTPVTAHCPATQGELLLGDGDDIATNGTVHPISIQGGDGADLIAGPGLLLGGAGNDRVDGHGRGGTVDGGPGDDSLLSADGPDQLRGGPGDDVLAVGESRDLPDEGDGVACGDGRDRVTRPDAADRLARDCELAVFPGGMALVPRSVEVRTDGRIGVRATCLKRTRTCRAKLAAGTPSGRALTRSRTVRLRAGRSRTIALTPHPGSSTRRLRRLKALAVGTPQHAFNVAQE